MNVNAKNGRVYFNGIEQSKIRPMERTNKETGEKTPILTSDGKQVYSVSLQVPSEFSRNGFAKVSTAFLNENRFDKELKDISYKEDQPVTVNVCSYNDRNDSSKNKYKDVEVTASQLGEKVQEYLDAKKERDAAKEAEAAAKEAEAAAAEKAKDEDEDIELG